ncbi:MAG: GGDEF domain-containing protein [Bacteroidales bacterium]|nr:GGDEF domain-containing protein [Candidatus Latescibacterota bacterium]
MCPGFEKDYRYLLTSLIPRHLLSSRRLEGVLDALSTGDRHSLLRESWSAMEELVENGNIHRIGTVRDNGRVKLHYKRQDNKASFMLEMTEDEWLSLQESKMPEKAGLISSVLAGIISSLTLNGTGITTTDKIEDILGLSGNIHQGARAFMILFTENDLHGVRDSDRIRIIPRENVLRRSYYSQVLEKDIICTFKNDSSVVSGESYFSHGRAGSMTILIPLSGRDAQYGIMQVLLPAGKLLDKDVLFNYNMIGQGVVRLLDNNRHLERLVSVDRLTGVNNRNFYETQLPLEIERATRNRKSLAFLIMDIDDFKKFNDEHGHDTGDEVLRLVAGAVREHLRKIDLFFRFGGEEFIALLPGAGREPAERTAERIREVVSKAGLRTDSGEELHITVTIGGCVYPEDAENEKELFRNADRMLLEAKEAGKNRIKFYH